jgi:hypothetical protein
MPWPIFSGKTGYNTAQGAGRRAKLTARLHNWMTNKHIDNLTFGEIDKKSWDHYQ